MRYLILGAGPAGLTVANRLLQRGEKDFLVLERNETAGGLCRSTDIDGSPFDIGGGHFLDVRRPEVLKFLFGFMPEEEWDRYDRDSRIFIHDQYIGSPIEANIWQLDTARQVEYLKAVAVAGCNLKEPMPTRFVDWIYWKLGYKIAENYMLPYNRKMFGENLDSLGTYWLEKLPDVSFDETLISCLEKKAYGRQPAHAVFYYPKSHGYGELWIRMAERLGTNIRYGIRAQSLDVGNLVVNDEYKADVIINTVPYKEFKTIKGMDAKHLEIIDSLKYSSVVTEYHPEMTDTPAHWVYYPDPKLPYHRILARHNFCPGSRGYWTETNLTRFEKDGSHEYFVNDYAYPLNTIGKNEAMDELLGFLRQKGIIGLGRWGQWQHFNSDVVVEKALELAERF